VEYALAEMLYIIYILGHTSELLVPLPTHASLSYSASLRPEPEFVNVYGAQVSIPRNRFLQPSTAGGPEPVFVNV
jgi:hypothetical protein